MNRPAATTPPRPTTCEIRVAGHLDDHWSAWLDDFTLTRHDDGTTASPGPSSTRRSCTASSPGSATSASRCCR